MSVESPRRDHNATGTHQPLGHRLTRDESTATRAAHEALDRCEAILAELDDLHEPHTTREWLIWRAGFDAGHAAGHLHGRHALLDEADATDQHAYYLWRATQHPPTHRHELGRDDPAFHNWKRARRYPV